MLALQSDSEIRSSLQVVCPHGFSTAGLGLSCRPGSACAFKCRLPLNPRTPSA